MYEAWEAAVLPLNYTRCGSNSRPQACTRMGRWTLPRDVPSARIRSFVVRAGRMGPGRRARWPSSAPRFVVPFAPRSGRCHAPPSAVRRRSSSRSASAWARPRPRSRAAAPEHELPRHRSAPAGRRRPAEADRRDGLDNVRIVQHDAVEVLEQMIAPASLAGVHIFFPDPWHKTRHHKRRLMQPTFVSLLASRLAPGGDAALRDRLATLCRADARACSSPSRRSPTPASRLRRRAGVRPLTKFEQRGLTAATASGISSSQARRPIADRVAARRRARSVGPDDEPAPRRRQHDDAEGDPIPGERHEGVGRDVAQQPAHAEPGGDEARRRSRRRRAARRPPTAARAP